MKITRKLRVLLAIAAILTVSFGLLSSSKVAHAVAPTDVPNTISFQGKIVKADGTNVSDGTYSITFKLYTSSGGATAIWGETQTSVLVTSGTFQVNLGSACSFFTTQTCSGFSNTAIDFGANPSLYLGITFSSDTSEMAPRPQLQSVPYAFNSDKVGGLTASQLVQLTPGTAQTGTINVTGTINGATISGGTLSGGIQSGGTVSGGTLTATSVNGLNISTTALGAAAALAVSSGGSGALTLSSGSGDISTGTNTINGQLLSSAASFSGTLAVTTLSSTAGTTAICYNTSKQLASCSANAAGVTLQQAYSTSSSPEITLNSANGALTIRDNSTAITGNLLEIQNNAGTTTYLGVSSAGAAVSGTLSATGALQGGTLSISGGVFAVNASGAITASTGIANSGGYVQTGTTANTLTGATTLSSTLAVQSATYTSGQVIINDGQTSAPPTYPNSYTPALTVITSEVSGSRPLFFGYNNGAGAYASYIDAGACASFDQMCFDLGDVSTQYTALQNVGSTLNIGGNAVAANADGNFATINITPGGGTTNIGGVLNVAGNINLTAASAESISGASGQNLTLQSQGAGGLIFNSASGTLGLSAVTNKVQRVTGGSNLTTILDLKDTTTSNTVLQLFNSGTGVANFQLYGGGLCTGAAACTTGGTTMRIDNAGDLTNIGNYTSTGGITGGLVSDVAHADTAAITYPEATEALGYVLSATTVNSDNASFTTTFNMTGLPATDGTIAFFTVTSAKVAAQTVQSITHTVAVVIGGQTVATVTDANGNSTAAASVTRSFTVMRMAGTWRVVGEGTTGTLNSYTPTNTTADYAEYIDYSGSLQPKAGDLLTVGTDPSSVKQSDTAYDTDALGVVSTSPYDVGGADDGHSVIIALTGRVPVNVNLENGPIKIGDKLTASSTSGEAMIATHAGHIIGTALSAYDGSQATAQVTVQLGVGYDDPGTTQTVSTGGIISPSLTSDGALTIDSGTVGDVSIDTGSTAGYVNVGTTKAAGVNVSQTGQTTTIAGALVINQAATFKGPVNLNDADTADALLSATNFNVDSAGNINTNGNLIIKGGSLSMTDAKGNALFTIDGSGNGVLAGSLNLASASTSGGLTVGGDLNVAGLSTFQKLATFIAKTVFKQDVEFDGHITVAADSAGYASLRKGETTVHVTFATAYDNPPVVSANTFDGQFVQVVVSNVTDQGFDVTIAAPATQVTKFSWTAVGVNNPRTASNPTPTTIVTPTP